MFDISALMSIAQIVIAIGGFIVLTRMLAGGEPGDIAHVFGAPWEPTWPRGVQEDDLLPWRVELVDRLNPRPHVVPDLVPDDECDECDEEAA
jgi:hypothetical protein